MESYNHYIHNLISIQKYEDLIFDESRDKPGFRALSNHVVIQPNHEYMIRISFQSETNFGYFVYNGFYMLNDQPHDVILREGKDSNIQVNLGSVVQFFLE
jgi:hypothetical protein